ncbi:MAG: alpha/beta hydrolase fold domain-containing protein [Muribaculum sp.]|nr:alpha/beta hydrolase fold domain-containing protein [Muribaculaceae bacterium]MCM1081273.1 alpha/beta hydrolase fold domain-containing protein [Muribaculum sp.]
MKILRFASFIGAIATWFVASAVQPTVDTHTFAIKGSDTLQLDILHTPANGQKRPAVIFLSGGGWEGQARRTAMTDTYPLLPFFVEKGFVGIAADYRCDFARARKSGKIPDKCIGDFVGDKQLDTPGVVKAIDRAVSLAVEDLFDATRFVVDNAEKYGIDTTKIVVVGSSAGAITALTAEYGICSRHKSARHLPAGFNYGAVVPMAGGIWCSGIDTLSWQRKPCPLLMFHGDADPIVSYSTIHVASQKWSMNGVKDIAAQLCHMGIPHQLFTYSEMNHDAAVVPMNTKLDYIYNFLRQTMLEPEEVQHVSPVATQWPEGKPFPGGENAMKGIVRTTFQYKTIGSDTLMLDIFEDPAAPRPMAGGKRPIMFYNYGGGWQAGNRHDMVLDRLDLCPFFARQGWTAVCFDYRLGFLRAQQQGTIPQGSIIEYIVGGKFADQKIWKAVQDAIDMAIDDTVDALAFTANNASAWQADTTRILGIGGSAGAINLLTLEHRLCNNTHPEQTSRLPGSFRFAALAPMAGGVWRTATDSLTWQTRPCPMFLFHGDADPIVPYDKVEYAKSKSSMWGSKQIAQQMWQMEVPCALYTVAGGDHAWSANPVIFNLPDLLQFVKRVLDQNDPLQLDIHQNTPGKKRDGYWFARYMAGQDQ